MTGTVDDSTVRDALRSVMDPEAGMNIVDLGLVYGIDASPAHGVRVELTMTSGACPMAEMICDEARVAIEAAVPPGTPVEIEMVWDPPWTPDRMSDRAREQFGWLAK
jgi:metal-sulfur cluster biosynthetic enzyme